jgi:import inner membrane translocase subunit TIM23
MFYEKMAGVIGPSYTAAFFIGGLIGLTKIPPPKNRRTYRLLANNYLNNIGKTSSRFGNNVGGAVLMYLVIGKGLNFIFREELESVSDMQKNALFGAVTGSLYKCTRGLRPVIFASFLGAACGSLYSYAWDKGYFKFV